MTVVFIDSGVDYSHSVFKPLIRFKEYGLSSDLTTLKIYDDPPKNGHGTAVLSAFVKETEDILDKITILSFRVFDDELETEPEALIKTLEYIYNNIDCEVINISCGLAQDLKELQSVCENLYKKGTYIVSAFSNYGNVSFPAAYDCVVGVDSINEVTRKDEYIYFDNSLINVGTAKSVQRLAWLNNQFVILQGNSYMTPIISAKICRWLLYNTDECIEQFLKKHATKIVVFKDNKENQKITSDIKPFKNVALFPYNKEISALIKFSYMLNFKIVGLYDSKYSGRIGLKVSDNKNIQSYTIENIDKCEWDKIDTFILGHIDELTKRTQVDYMNTILDKCSQNDIKVFSFDNINYKRDQNPQIYFPKIVRTKQSMNKNGKLYNIFSPVLCIAGTSSMQGKFTLQIKLRDMFIKDGYYVGQLSSEPEGELMGMDYTFPYGYRGTVELEGFEFIEHVNYLIHMIDLKAPDIIITGAQSGTCVLGFDNLETFNLPSINYLLGVKPDAIVLCVNYHDSLEMIERSVIFMESLVDASVVGIMLFPMGFRDEWSIIQGKKEIIPYSMRKDYCDLISSKIRPAYLMGEDLEERTLYKTIINFFNGDA